MRIYSAINTRNFLLLHEQPMTSMVYVKQHPTRLSWLFKLQLLSSNSRIPLLLLPEPIDHFPVSNTVLFVFRSCHRELSALIMSKTEQKACLSTSSRPDLFKPLPRHESSSQNPPAASSARRVRSKHFKSREVKTSNSLDYILFLCYILVYLELGWLILLLLRSFISRH